MVDETAFLTAVHTVQKVEDITLIGVQNCLRERTSENVTSVLAMQCAEGRINNMQYVAGPKSDRHRQWGVLDDLHAGIHFVLRSVRSVRSGAPESQSPTIMDS